MAEFDCLIDFSLKVRAELCDYGVEAKFAKKQMIYRHIEIERFFKPLTSPAN